MKKLIYILLIVIGCISMSCSSEQPKNNEHIARVCTQSGEYVSCRMDVLKVEHKDHEYLLFYWGGGRCIVHDPDCSCNKQNSEYQPSEYLY